MANSRERVNGAQKLENRNLFNFCQKIFFSFLLVFLFGLGFSAKASAATIYIDPTCATPGDGTSQVCSGSAAPKQTWASVIWTTGNTYLQKGGTTANETIVIGASGSDESHRTIVGSYGAGNAIVDGQSSRSYGIYTNSKSFITIQDIEFKNAASTNVYFNGGNYNTVSHCNSSGGGYSINTAGVNDHIIISDFVSNNAVPPSGAAIYINNESITNLSINNLTVNGYSSRGMYLKTGNGLSLSNIVIGSGITGLGIDILGNNLGNVSIDGLRVTSTPAGQNGIYIHDIASAQINMSNIFAGVAPDGSAGGNGNYGLYIKNITNSLLTIDGLQAKNNPGNAVYIETSSFLSGSFINNFDTSSNASETTGIYVKNSSNLTLSNGASNYNGFGVWVVGSSSSNIIIDHVTADHNSLDGIDAMTGVPNLIVRYSEASYNGTAGLGITNGAGDGFSIHDTCVGDFYYNIAHHNLNTGMAHTGASSGHIYNNVIYANGSSSDATMNRAGLYLTTTANPGFIVRNNIVSQNYPYDYEDVSASSHNDIDYNNYYSIDTNKFYRPQDLDTQTSWSTYHATKESHSSNIDPKFVSSSDFHLQNISPAINAGANVSLLKDYDNQDVPSGPLPDIGVYEFQDSTKPTTIANIVSGTYNSVQSVTLTCDDGGGVGCDKTYYTLDGTDPTTSSTQYSGAISTPDNATTVLKFFSRDKNLNSETPIKSKTYTIDTTAPNTTINSNPDFVINTSSAAFTFSASETSTFQCKIDSGAYATCTSPKNYTSLAEGVHTFYVKAIDSATNEDAMPASYAFTIDTQVPTISNLSPNNTTLSVETTSTNLTLTTSETTACKYSAISGTDYASMTAFDSTNNTTHSTNIFSLNSGATYNYYIKCKDAINESSEERLIFSIAPEENNISLNSIKVKIDRETNKFKDKIYSWENKFKLKGNDRNLTNGTIKIYKDGKRIEAVDVGSDGAWNKILKLKDNFSGWIRVRQYDQFGTLLGTKKVKVKVDTEKPEFTSFFWPLKSVIPEVTKLTWGVKDNDKIDKYKIYVGGRIYTTKFNTFQIPRETTRGIQYIKIKAYDKAGNSAFKETYIRVK